MSTPTEFGAVREIWMAPIANPTQKSSFLIRDDAYTKSGAIFGRQLRLGDPVTLGPNGTWKQETWEGGRDQDTWRDAAMFQESSADVTTKRGRLKLWDALGEIYHQTGRTNVNRFCLGTNAQDASRATATHLLIGESNIWATGTPAGGFCLYRKNPGGALTTIKSNFASGIAAISPPDDNSQLAYIGCDNGEIWTYNPVSGATGLVITDPNGPIRQDSMTLYNNKLYWLAGRCLRSRYNDGTTVTYKNEFFPPGVTVSQGLVVWNNRLWFAGVTPSRHTHLYVHDGVQTVEAFSIPDEFECHAMVVHYGKLYLCGSNGGADRTSSIGIVYQYNGATLTKLFETGKGNDGEDHTIWDMAVYRQWLLWTHSGTASNGYRSGVMMYDAEQDAIFMGPNRVDAGQEVRVHSVQTYDQTWVLSMWNVGTTDVYVRPLRKLDRKRGVDAGTVEQSVTSSAFWGDVPSEKKVWLTGRVTCKLDSPDAQIEVKVKLSEGSEQSVKVIDYDASNTGWREVVFPIKAGGTGDYLRSTWIQYVIYLRNTSTDGESTATPEVETVAIDFMVSPAKRRQWRLRTVCSDAQSRLDGSANPLTTTSALLSKLEDFYEAQTPFYFWDAGTAGGTPADTSNAVEVFCTDFGMQTFRLESTDTAIDGEVALSLVEVVQA